MTLDLLIAGGDVFDGSGGEPRHADVGIAGGRIVEIGDLAGAAATSSIDARGCAVTPGFIDVHTHLDAQLCWDRAAIPTALHGVTTVLTGMCGFGIAPCPEDGLEHLLRSLEAVEEIPYEASSAAVSQRWRTFAEFLSFLSASAPCVNVGAMVPHSALRYAVMGERGLTEVATDDDRHRLVGALREALDAGALGMSTSRGGNHVDGMGRPVPSRCADDVELQTLVAACRDRVWQINVAAKSSADTRPLLEELDRYAGWTAAADARLTWTPLMGDDRARVAAVLDQVDEQLARGAHVRPQVPAQPMTVAVSFAFECIATRLWPDAMVGFYERSGAERMALLDEPSFRDVLRRPPAATAGGARLTIDDWVIAVSPSAPALVGETLGDAARRAGTDPIDLLCSLAVADGLETLLQAPAANRDRTIVHSLVRDDRVLVGLGDSGAHVRTVTNFTYPTTMLREAAAGGEGDVARAVRALTSVPARFFGLRHRGTIAAGRPADVNVVDLSSLSLGPLETRTDLPNGGTRLFQRATGYRATLVNGVVSVLDGTPTFAGAGTVFGPADLTEVTAG